MRILILLITLFFFVLPVHADEISDLQDQINELNKQRQLSISATKPLEGQLDSLKRQLTQIQTSIDNLTAKIFAKQKQLEEREDKVALQQALLEKRVKAYYIRSYLTDPLIVILSSIQAGDLFRELSYRQSVAREDRQVIVSITAEIVNLLTQKSNLEKDKARLAILQADVDKNAKFIGGEVAKAKAFQADLSSKIAQLTARQQQIISQRLGSLNIPRSAGTTAAACTDDRSIDPGFSPRIAFFTYGVPNRTGLNQYGAWGRAKAGQSEEVILRAYYEGINFETKPNITIKVQGYGEMPLETYLLGIYEIPDSWTENNLAALKAQAIAARSYAIAYTNNGAGEICTTQACQVYKGGNKGGNWEQAVKQTEGKVMVNGGQVIKAWYSSTHGGYILATSELPGWSATSWTKHATDTSSSSAGSFSDLQSSAYDKDSPWFYCDWGSRSQYNKTAWLKPSEIADIVNIILLARADSGTKDHFYQTDKQHPYGGEVWNEERVKSELRSRNITPFNSVSDISVGADFGSGRTSSINFSGDGGSQSFSGSEFKDWFNLRAPANIQIVGPLFNVEQK